MSFEKIIDKSAAIIFMVDAQQKIVFANQKAKDVLGVSLELQSENKSLRDLHRCEQDYWAFGELQRIAFVASTTFSHPPLGITCICGYTS